MVNAKNAFMSILIAGLVIAAVGQKKFNSGNWDSVSSDFTIGAAGGEFKHFAGRFYADNVGQCNMQAMGSSSKGTECTQDMEMSYQIEMANDEFQMFATDKTITTKNLVTMEENTIATPAPVPTGTRNPNHFTAKNGKIVGDDGLELSITNPVSPGKAIRNMWNWPSLPTWDDVWNFLTSCSTVFAYWLSCIPQCLIFTLGVLAGAATAGVSTVINAPGFIVVCGGFVVTGILSLLLCGMEIIDNLWDSSALGHFEDCLRSLRGMGGSSGAGQGSQGNHPPQPDSSTVDSTICQPGGGGPCRVLNLRQLGGCRALAQDEGQGGGCGC